VTIKSARVGDVVLTEDDISKALAELGNTFGLSAGEVHQRVISHGIDRTTAAGWVQGIRDVHAELSRAGQMPTQGSTANMIAEYTAKYPPVDAGGNRLCLTAGNGNRPAMSEADAASEISRIALTHNQPSGRVRFDLQRVAASAITAPEHVELAARQYDDSSELRLTAPVNGQAAADAEVARLAASSHGGKFIDMARHDVRDSTGSFTPAAPSGHSTNPLVSDLDTGAPAVSDLSQQLSPPDQNWKGGTFSPFAQSELDSLPDSLAEPIQTELDAANQASSSLQAAGHLLRAVNAARGTKHLARELRLRAHAAIDAGASGVPDPAAAQQQVAGSYNVQAEVDRLSSLGTGNDNGNRKG
jgi:hypothetical protein